MEERGKRRSGPLGTDSTPAERVTWLLDTLWNGNRSQMAQAVGCAHSVLSKIAAGKQKPGRALLGLIAEYPKINPVWLMAGEGEPILPDRPESVSEGWPLPITETLFRGSPDLNRRALTGQQFPVAGVFYQADRYWLELRPKMPILQSKQPVREGDLLLMDPDRTSRSDLRALDGRLCIVSSGEAELDLKLGLVSYSVGDHEEPARLAIDTFDSEHYRANAVQEIIIRVFPDGHTESQTRTVGKLGKRVSQLTLMPTLRDIKPADIVAVSRLLIRR